MLRSNRAALRCLALGLCLLAPLLIADCGGGTGGSSSSGPDCGECLRPISCVEQCGGEVVQSGCCPCPSGSFDRDTCADGGADAAKM